MGWWVAFVQALVLVRAYLCVAGVRVHVWVQQLDIHPDHGPVTLEGIISANRKTPRKRRSKAEIGIGSTPEIHGVCACVYVCMNCMN